MMAADSGRGIWRIFSLVGAFENQAAGPLQDSGWQAWNLKVDVEREAVVATWHIKIICTLLNRRQVWKENCQEEELSLEI